MKYFLFILSGLILLSCGGGQEEGWTADDTLVEHSPFAAGEKVYMSSCVACHQKNGEGLEGAFPPLANSDYLLADSKRAISIAADGMDGEITVNGTSYNSIMAPQGLSNEEVRDVVNYIMNSWGNNGGEVTLVDVEGAIN